MPTNLPPITEFPNPLHNHSSNLAAEPNQHSTVAPNCQCSADISLLQLPRKVAHWLWLTMLILIHLLDPCLRQLPLKFFHELRPKCHSSLLSSNVAFGDSISEVSRITSLLPYLPSAIWANLCIQSTSPLALALGCRTSEAPPPFPTVKNERERKQSREHFWPPLL